MQTSVCHVYCDQIHVCQYVHCSYNVSSHELKLFMNFQGGHLRYVAHDGLKPILCNVFQCQCKHVFEFSKSIYTASCCLKGNTYSKAAQ